MKRVTIFSTAESVQLCYTNRYGVVVVVVVVVVVIVVGVVNFLLNCVCVYVLWFTTRPLRGYNEYQEDPMKGAFPNLAF